MDMEKQPETEKKTNVEKIISDFNKKAAKMAQKKENTLISYAIKATARDQDKNIMISKLKREIEIYLDKVTILKVENEIKEELLEEKDAELKELKTENEKLKASLEQRKHESPKAKSYISKSTVNQIYNDVYNYNNNNYEVVSTFTNIIASPKNEVVIKDQPYSVVSTTSKSPIAEVTKPKTSKLKRSFKRTRDHSQITSIVYNLRKRISNQNLPSQ